MDLEVTKAIEYAFRIAQFNETAIVGTAPEDMDSFLKRGFRHIIWMKPAGLAYRLRDKSWKGLDGKGCYDTILTIGVPYHLAWMMLTGLKENCPHLTIISLDRFYQPHATWSFPTLTIEDWKEYLEQILRISQEMILYR
jgi:acetyl-CoA decarbonylase/synthase complex subunit epsilon